MGINELRVAVTLVSLAVFLGIVAWAGLWPSNPGSHIPLYGSNPNQKMEDLRDAANNAAKSDRSAGEYIRRESQETYLRSSDFGWSNRNK